jgi:hypothetical protein
MLSLSQVFWDATGHRHANMQASTSAGDEFVRAA